MELGYYQRLHNSPRRRMDRTPFTLSFTKDEIPEWTCPTCGLGRLKLAPDNLVFKEGVTSKGEFDHPAWEPGWIEYRFTAMFTCSNKGCEEDVSCAGTGTVNHFTWEIPHTGEEGDVTEDIFRPKIFIPPLVLMDIPEKCPDPVRLRLAQSFALFFADPAAAMNAGRTAVEALLTALKVPRFKKKKNGGLIAMVLHERIQRLPAKYSGPLGEMLTAVKWLGNAGSHDGDEPTTKHVLLMYDLLEHCLAEIYDNKLQRLRAAAKKVNKRKGP